MKKRFIILIVALTVMTAVTCLYVALESSTYTERLDWLTDDHLTNDEISVTLENEDVVTLERVYLDENHTICADFKSVGPGNANGTFSIERHGNVAFTLHVNSFGMIINTRTLNFDGFIEVELVILSGLALIIIVMLVTFFECLKKAMFSYTMISCGGIALFCAAIMTVLIYGMQWQNTFDQFLTQFFATGGLFAIVSSPLIMIICILISISNIQLIRREGFRPQNMLGIVLGVVWFVAMIPVYSTAVLFRGGIFDVAMLIKLCLSYIVSLMTCLLLFTIICAFLSTRHKPPYDRDYLIILGCCIKNDGSPTPILKGRIDAAVKFEKEQLAATGKIAKFVTSGGQGSDEIISESESMKRYLIEQGYPEDRIIKEDKSVNTDQNIQFSRDKIKEDAGTLENIKAGVATTNYHIFRSYVLSKKHGLEAEGISAKTKWYFYPNAFLREFVGLLFDQKIKLAVIAVLIIASCLIGSQFVFTRTYI